MYEQKEKNTQSIDKKAERPLLMKVACAAGAIAIAMTMIGGEYYARDPLFVPRVGLEYIANPDGNEVSVEAITTVEYNLSHPDNAGLIEIGRQLSSQGDDEISFEQWLVRYDKYCEEKAADAGIELVDADPYKDKIKKAKTTDEVTAITDLFCENYGFDFELGENATIKDTGIIAEPIKKSDMKIGDYKKGAINFVGALGQCPVELVKLADIDSFEVVESFVNPNAAAMANPISGKLYINYETMTNSDFEPIMHEISHRLDSVISGIVGMSTDKEFSELNPSDFEYGRKNSSKNKEVVCVEYGSTNIKEDKATYMQTMINGLDQDLAYSKNPTIRAKYRLLLARLEQRIPGVTKYLVSVGVDPTL